MNLSISQLEQQEKELLLGIEDIDSFLSEVQARPTPFGDKGMILDNKKMKKKFENELKNIREEMIKAKKK